MIKQTFSALNNFIKNNFFTGLILVALGVYFWPESGNPIAFKSYNNEGSYASMDMVQAESMNISSRGARMQKVAQDYIRPPVANAQFEPDTNDRKIIKNASLQLEVENTEEAKTLVEAEVLALDGYVTNQNSWEVRTQILAYNMTIRVPANSLENLINNLTSLGIKKGENYSINDITAAYSDTDNEIKNLETRRARLRKLMEFETESLNDILQVDRELTTVQNQIDNLARTQKGRDTDVDYSTLQLTVNPQPEIGDFSSPEWNLDKSWKTSVNDFIHDARNIVDKLIKIAVYTPIWLPALLIFWLIRKWFKRSRNTKKTIKKK